MCSHTPSFSIRVLLSIVGLLLAGCGTRSGLGVRDAGGGVSAIPSGGNTGTVGVGGTGGDTNGASGGATILVSAGSPASAGADGGAAPGGAGMVRGGSSAFASGDVAGSASNGGAGGASLMTSSLPPSCTGVTCPGLPKSCKKIVQDPTACCPVCTEMGGCSNPCNPINCLAGTHSETLAGDCCPSCVADPLDACAKGQQAYAELRKQLLDKYGSTKCQNSLECSLVLESNACATVCNVALPTSTAGSYRDNLDHVAVNCASCPPQDPILCERMVAACLNGKCVAVDPS